MKVSTLQETNTELSLLTNVLKMKAYGITPLFYDLLPWSHMVIGLVSIQQIALLALNRVRLSSNEITAKLASSTVYGLLATTIHNGQRQIQRGDFILQNLTKLRM
jgi:hypothetical protein